MIALDARAAAAEFLQSDDGRELAAWDASQPSDSVAEVWVVLSAAWPELGRASRAFDAFDREVRRCGAAHRQSLDASGALLFEPTPLSELAAYPRPCPETDGFLEVVESSRRPTTVVTWAAGLVFAALRESPALSLGYAMAAFGTPFAADLYGGCSTDAAPDLDDVLTDETIGWAWQPSAHIRVTRPSIVPPKGRFRAVSEHRPHRETDQRGLRILAVRTRHSGVSDLLRFRMNPVPPGSLNEISRAFGDSLGEVTQASST